MRQAAKEGGLKIFFTLHPMNNTTMTQQTYLDLSPLTFPSPADKTIEESFLSFHAANPHVYRNLVTMARDLAKKGRKRIGIKMLFESLRWRYMLETDDPSSDYKLNNNYTSRYARLIAENESDLANIFQTRELKAA